VANSTSQFSQTPRLFSMENKATTVKISPDEKYVIVGTNNGTVKIFSINGFYINTVTGHSASIIDI
jgi:WD40 repeat protein